MPHKYYFVLTSIIILISLIICNVIEPYDVKKSTNVYRINSSPCTQETKRCYYPYTNDKKVTSYLCCKNHLIDLLSFIVDVFNKNKVTYFLDYGTLLGCIRSGGFIPWDTDIDIAVIDDGRLGKIMDIIRKNNKNYHLVKESNEFYRLNFSKKNTLHVDIMIRKKNKLNYYTDMYQESYLNKTSIRESDLFPLKTIHFDKIFFKIQNKFEKYLKNFYGEDCITNPKTRGEYE